MRAAILLAEGDSELRGLYSEYLRKQGYAVAVAAHGLDCLQQLRQTSPDVLVIDLELTWGGGDGVVDWLRADSGRAKLPVILTAAGCRSQGPDRASPVVDFLPKPFALAALADSIRAALAPNEPERRGHPPPTPSSELCIG